METAFGREPQLSAVGQLELTKAGSALSLLKKKGLFAKQKRVWQFGQLYPQEESVMLTTVIGHGDHNERS